MQDKHITLRKLEPNLLYLYFEIYSFHQYFFKNHDGKNHGLPSETRILIYITLIVKPTSITATLPNKSFKS